MFNAVRPHSSTYKTIEICESFAIAPVTLFYIYTYIHIDAYIYTYIYVLYVHGVPGGSLVCASERGHSALMFLVLGSSLAC